MAVLLMTREEALGLVVLVTMAISMCIIMYTDDIVPALFTFPAVQLLCISAVFVDVVKQIQPVTWHIFFNALIAIVCQIYITLRLIMSIGVCTTLVFHIVVLIISALARQFNTPQNNIMVFVDKSMSV